MCRWQAGTQSCVDTHQYGTMRGRGVRVRRIYGYRIVWEYTTVRNRVQVRSESERAGTADVGQ